MIPAEVMERARKAAREAYDLDVPYLGSAQRTVRAENCADAALRSLLTDLRERFDTLYSPQMGYGDLERHPVDEVDALLLELGDE